MSDDTTEIIAQASPAHRAPFVGRESLLEQIEARLKTTLNGRGGGLVLRGISGVGKTRLAHASVAKAQTLDMRAIYLPCRGTRFRPSDPIAVLLRTLFAIDDHLPRKRQRELLKKSLSYLGQDGALALFSEVLGLATPDERAGAELDSAHDVTLASADALFKTPQRLNLPDTLLRLIEALTRHTQRVVIVADDLDEAHEATRSTLIALAGELLELPALLIATFPPEAEESIQAAFGQSVIDIGPLNREETAAMAEGLVDTPLSEEALTTLWEGSDGFPLIVGLAIALLEADERIEVDEASEKAIFTTGRKLPAIGRMILSLAEKLPADARRLLDHAAILADGFRIGAIANLGDQPLTDELNTRLDLLWEKGWLERSGADRRATYRFPNRVTRQVIYQAIDAEVREGLHRKAGDYYAVPSTGRRMRTENALYHFLRVNDVARGLDLIEMALVQAKQGDDLTQMMALYKQGVELATNDPRYVDRQTAMAEALGDLLAAAGEYRRAVDAYSHHAPGQQPALLQAKLGLVLLAVDPPRGVKILKEVAPTIPRNAAKDLYFRVQAGLVWGEAQAGHTYEAIRRSRDVLAALADTTGFGSARTLMRGTLGMAMHYFDDPVEAHTHLESARAGWSARGEQDGILLVNQILIEMPEADLIHGWLAYVLRPLIDVKMR